MPAFCRCLLSVVVTIGCKGLFLLISASKKKIFIYLFTVNLGLPSQNYVKLMLLVTDQNYIHNIIFLSHIYVLSVTVLTCGVAPPKMFCSWYRI